ncbi:MAG: transporter permease [Glaciihabitans sp.]|nr:transporter permease [Glaciihabitans sp.]
MTLVLDPFASSFMLRALLGGVLVAMICAVVGTWVVVRGMAFLGEAMAHGMLPGVAVAALLGLPAVLGAAVSAVVMTVGIGVVSRRSRLSQDTSIGLLFVGMLALGVIIVSKSRSFAVDLTSILFGDVLAIQRGDLVLLLGVLVIVVAIALLGHRSFVALAFDARVASTLGLRPKLAQVVLVGLITLAVVASYQAVGTLLVVGLLLAPAVAAAHWVRSLTATMVLAAILGSAAILTGLLVSWYAATAAGASIAAVSIGFVVLSAAAKAVVDVVTRRRSTGDGAQGAGAPGEPTRSVTGRHLIHLSAADPDPDHLVDPDPALAPAIVQKGSRALP